MTTLSDIVAGARRRVDREIERQCWEALEARKDLAVWERADFSPESGMTIHVEFQMLPPGTEACPPPDGYGGLGAVGRIIRTGSFPVGHA